MNYFTLALIILLAGCREETVRPCKKAIRAEEVYVCSFAECPEQLVYWNGNVLRLGSEEACKK